MLSVEMDELGINAGLQDRVVQCYEGLVYMDFAREVMARHNGAHGAYTELDARACLPARGLFLCYLPDPSDSGKIHSDVKCRWLDGDAAVIEGMKVFGALTVQARHALEAGDWPALRKLMDLNFDQRRKLYGDACIGADNLRMVSIARAHGAAAKFSGSGGAIVGFCDDARRLGGLRAALEAADFVFTELRVQGGGK